MICPPPPPSTPSTPRAGQIGLNFFIFNNYLFFTSAASTNKLDDAYAGNAFLGYQEPVFKIVLEQIQ